jgi:hypothetical protein
MGGPQPCVVAGSSPLGRRHQAGRSELGGIASKIPGRSGYPQSSRNSLVELEGERTIALDGCRDAPCADERLALVARGIGEAPDGEGPVGMELSVPFVVVVPDEVLPILPAKRSLAAARPVGFEPAPGRLVVRQRMLPGGAKPAYLSRFFCLPLPVGAGCCDAGGVRVASTRPRQVPICRYSPECAGRVVLGSSPGKFQKIVQIGDAPRSSLL